MKLVVAGATGFVGTEVVRQALSIPSITSVVALGRRETSVPEKLHPGTDTSKFKSLVVPDFNNYSQDAKAELADADACVWYVQLALIHALRITNLYHQKGLLEFYPKTSRQ